MVAFLVLAAQLSACPPTLTCTLPALQTTPAAVVSTRNDRAAKWATAAIAAQVIAFDVVMLERHESTLSHFSQHESAAHPVVRWSIVAGCLLAAGHLAFHGPLW